MKGIEKIIQDAALIGDPHVNGRIARFDAMLPQLLQLIPGNIVEIGAGHGDSTKVFLKHARDFDRKVLVIDPFEDGWDNMPDSYGKPYPYHVFAENTKGYEDVLSLCKHPSDSAEAYTAVKNHAPVSFIFLDGMQTLKYVNNDFYLASCVASIIICIDDISRSNSYSVVPSAIRYLIPGSVTKAK